MDTVTYPHPDVVSFLEQSFVPAHFHVTEQADVLEPYAIVWTPGLIVLDAEGRQLRRFFGWHGPKELLAELSLACVEAAVEREDFDAAHQRLSDAKRHAAGDREREAEALYFEAVVAYKRSGEAKDLIGGWQRLMRDFAGTTWA